MGATPTRPTIHISPAASHPGCGIVPAALANAELKDCSGSSLAWGGRARYDVGRAPQPVARLQPSQHRRPFDPQPWLTVSRRAAPRRCSASTALRARHVLSYGGSRPPACLLASRHEHVEKAFTSAAWGRNGSPAPDGGGGILRYRRPFSARNNFYTRSAEPAPPSSRASSAPASRSWRPRSRSGAWARRISRCSSRHGPARRAQARADDWRAIPHTMPDDRTHIVDNLEMPDVCVQHSSPSRSSTHSDVRSRTTTTHA